MYTSHSFSRSTCVQIFLQFNDLLVRVEKERKKTMQIVMS